MLIVLLYTLMIYLYRLIIFEYTQIVLLYILILYLHSDNIFIHPKPIFINPNTIFIHPKPIFIHTNTKSVTSFVTLNCDSLCKLFYIPSVSFQLTVPDQTSIFLQGFGSGFKTFVPPENPTLTQFQLKFMMHMLSHFSFETTWSP